jgi:imidazolonepropionase-like amidohydrolase
MRKPEPTIVASGPPLTSVGGHCHYLGGEVTTKTEISAAIRERLGRGVDVVKVMASGGMTTPGTDITGTEFSADQMRLMVQQSHEAGLPITAYAHALPAVEQAVDAGVDCIEHCSCLTQRGFVLSDELLASIADRDIAMSCVLTPKPRMDCQQSPASLQKLAATGFTCGRRTGGHQRSALHDPQTPERR